MNLLKKNLIVGGLAGILLAGCGKDDVDPLPEPEEPQIPPIASIYENVETLSENQLENISSVDATSIYFVTPADFRKGEIIIGGISEKTPGGILRKITSISEDNKKFTTTSATLEEVIRDGEFSVNKKLTANDLEQGSKLKSASSHEFYYPIEKTVIFDLDENLNTTNDQITVEGGVYFDLNYEFSPKFREGVREVRFSTLIKQKAELNFIGNLDKEINKEINLYSQSFLPFVIPTPLAIPLVLRPKLELNAGVIGEIHGRAHARVEEEFVAVGNLHYINDSWKSTENLEKGFGAEFVEAKANANLKGYVSPRLDLIVNEIAGPFALAEGYLEINVDTQKNPWWELYGGANVSVGIDMGLLSKIIPDYEKSLIEYRELICCAEGEMQKKSFFEDFESYSEGEFPSTWIADGNAKNSPNQIITEGDNKILQLYGLVGQCWGALAYSPREIDPPYDLSVKIKNGSENLRGCHLTRAGVGLREGDSWTNPWYKFFDIDEEGYFYVSTNKKISKLDLDKWYQIDIKMDKHEMGHYNLNYYIDGEFVHSAYAQMSKLRYKNFELASNEGTAYFDDFKIVKRE